MAEYGDAEAAQEKTWGSGPVANANLDKENTVIFAEHYSGQIPNGGEPGSLVI